MGTTRLAAPTAHPTILLPTIISVTVEVRAWIRAPATKKTSATITTTRRPCLSARIPAAGDAKRAKREVHDVMRDLSRTVKGLFDRSVFIETKVEEMTPVLRRRQRIIAVAAISELTRIQIKGH